MNKIKSLNQLSDEELLKLLENPEDIDFVRENSNDVLSFIHFFNIQPGRTKVKSYFLYILYKDWSKLPIKRKEFSLEMSKYLDLNSHSFFYIDRNHLKLLQKSYEILQKKSHNDPLLGKNKKIHFEHYLKFYNIKLGNYWIEREILYFYYDKWCYKNKLKMNVLSEKNFNRFIKIYFKDVKMTKDYKIWVNVDEKVLKITQEDIVRIRNSYAEKTKKDSEKSQRKKRLSSLRTRNKS